MRVSSLYQRFENDRANVLRCLGKRLIDMSEEKAVAKLGITYGVLRRLGFSEERVVECLRAIKGVDLEEAYGWVCSSRIVHYSP